MPISRLTVRLTGAKIVKTGTTKRATVKNITADLQERLAEIADEQTRLQRELDTLADRESTLKSLLEIEASRWGQGQQQRMLPENGNGHGSSDSKYGNFLIQALDQGEHNLAYLKRLAKDMQIDFGNKSPGRTLHFALVGLKRSGVVERTEDDNWTLANK